MLYITKQEDGAVLSLLDELAPFQTEFYNLMGLLFSSPSFCHST